MHNSQGKTKSIWAHYRAAAGGKLLGFFLCNAIVYGGAAFVLNVLVPEYYKNIIDAIFEYKSYEAVVSVFWGLVGMTLVYFILDRVAELWDVSLMIGLRRNVAMYAANAPLDHSYGFFVNNFAGALVNKEKKFVSAIDQMLQIVMRDLLYAAIVAVGVLFILFKYSTILGGVALFWFVIFLGCMFVMTRRRLPYERARGIAQSISVGVLSDIITNVINLKYFSSKKREMEYFKGFLNSEAEANRKAWMMATKSYTAQGFIVNLAQLTLMFASIMLWSRGEITSGVIVLVISYSGILFNRLGNLGSVMRRFTESYIDAREFVDVINTPIEIKDPKNPQKPLDLVVGKIDFNNIMFGYSKDRIVIKDFNLSIKAGEKVGFVGSSGAGKTTITKLLLRFADVTQGSISIDGQNISAITQDDLRNMISYVPQDTLLFHRSLKDNIAYGKPNATEEEVIDASKKAHAHEFIVSLPKRYDTLVGERGVKLSGGERQRVAIARAILKDAPILVLDEATSSLDSESEMYIQQGLEELMKDRTTIVIAHRLSTIQKMDRIVVFENGRIIEEGPHAELLKKKGKYHDLWQRQSGGFIQ